MLYLFCCLTYTKATWKGGDVVGAYYFAYCFRYGRCDLPPHLQMVGRKRLEGQPAQKFKPLYGIENPGDCHLRGFRC